MFSREPDRPPVPGTTPLPGVRDLSAGPQVAPQTPSPSTGGTVVARSDRLQGTLKVAGGLLILGTVEGKIETTTLVIEEGARVSADVVADEVIIGGEYTGKLSCKQRLEVRRSGVLSGKVETLRLMFHEGASIDGDIRMLKPPAAATEPLGRGSVRSDGSPRAAAGAAARSVGERTAAASAETASEAAGATPAPVAPGAEPIR
jgi:cytoskeletal protein CcmA (bactofilin family)